MSPTTVIFPRNDGGDGEKKRLKATSTISLRTYHRLDDMLPMLEPNIADVHAALRASKRPKKEENPET